MTTNQTIDGVLVPRETLQRWLDDIGPSRHVTQYAALKRDELRALLDASEPTVFGCNRCGGTQAEWTAKCVHCHPAAQPQGEPMAVESLEIVGRQCFPSEMMKKIPNYRTEPWVDGDIHQSPSAPYLYRIEPLVRLSDVTRLNTK